MRDQVLPFRTEEVGAKAFPDLSLIVSQQREIAIQLMAEPMVRCLRSDSDAAACAGAQEARNESIR
jgi:hypothetical protein